MRNSSAVFCFDTELSQCARQEPLGVLLQQLEGRLIQVPDHQREFVWSDYQVERWAESLRRKTLLPGSIITYQIAGHGPVFLNDGFQRLTATRKISEDLGKYRFTPEDFTVRLLTVTATRQHFHYKDEFDAIQEFQDVQHGTGLTPYEYYKCEFVKQFGARTRDILSEFRDGSEKIQHALRVFGNSGEKSKKQKDKYRRYAYVLYWRWAGDDVGLRDFRVGEGIPRPDTKGGGVPIERVVAKHRTSISSAQVSESFSRLAAFIERELQALKVEMEREDRRFVGRNLTSFHSHFMADMCIAMHRLNIEHSERIAFAKRVIEFLYDADAFKPNAGLGMGKLSPLRKLALHIKWPFADALVLANSKKKRNKKHQSVLVPEPGLDIGHIKAVSKHGEGETLLEPAIVNRARGCRDMTEEEIKKVSDWVSARSSA